MPLSTQALSILKELHPLTGDGTFVFLSTRSTSRPMSDNAILAALRRLGISKEEATGHGFRASARTMLDEVLNVRPDIIEHQLARAVWEYLKNTDPRYIEKNQKVITALTLLNAILAPIYKSGFFTTKQKTHLSI